MSSYDKEAIKKIAQNIKAAGFRVFIAKSGTYGFYTDDAGSRVVSFGVDLGTVKLSGNYKTSAPKQCGTGWGLKPTDNYNAAFNEIAPSFAVPNGVSWRYTTLAEYLKNYQESSKFVEDVDNLTNK